MKSFRIRNVLCDFYLAETNSLDRLKYGADADAKLPVLRMFGITDDGSVNSIIRPWSRKVLTAKRFRR